MEKSEQFLYIVTPTIIANAANLLSDHVSADTYRHIISASGVRYLMSEAVRAAELIPSNLSAAEAADQFTNYCLDNLREQAEKASGDRASVPTWFQRG